MAIVVPLLVLAVVVGAAVVAWRWNQKRQAERFAWARARGLTYARRDDTILGRWVCEPFSQGGRRERIEDVVQGEWHGRKVISCTYVYETQSSGSNGSSTTETHRCTMAVVEMPTYLNGVLVQLENALTRLGSHLGFSDIELESEEFNRRYRVKAEDRKFASDVLTPRTMQLMLAGPALPVQLTGNVAMTWDSRGLQLDKLEARWELLAGIIDGIPSFVWKDAGLG